MEDEPSRFLSDANLFGQLHRRNALARGHQQVHGVEPLVEGNVRPFKNGPRSHRKIQLAGMAAVEAAFSGSDAIWGLAVRTNGAMRPKPGLQVMAGRLGTGDLLKELKGADRTSAHRFLE
jgi:hypothetical protein